MKYKFEEYIERNEMDISVIAARRFARAVREAIGDLEREARCYHLTNEPYYIEIQEFLQQKLARLEAPLKNKE